MKLGSKPETQEMNRVGYGFDPNFTHYFAKLDISNKSFNKEKVDWLTGTDCDSNDTYLGLLLTTVRQVWH